MRNIQKKITLFTMSVVMFFLLLPTNNASAQTNPTTLQVGQTKNIDVNADNNLDLQVEVIGINPDGRPVIKLTKLQFENYVYTVNFMDYITSLYTNMVIATTILSWII